MLPLAVIALMAIVAALAFANFRADRRVAADSPRRRVAAIRGPHAAAPPPRPVPMDLEWGSEIAPKPTAPGPASPSNSSSDAAAARAKIRDRYVAVRFPGIAQSAADLAKVERVIPAARLFFEEEQPDRAIELLQLAIEEYPECEPTRLAQLEIAFLVRDAALFCERARDFRRVRPGSSAWMEIARLGRAISPDEALFGPAQGPKGHEHFGPWPDMPNWIQASWDLTAEVLAADFHRGMRSGAGEAESRAKAPAQEEMVS